MIKIVLAYFLLLSQAFAGLPPTTLKGQTQTAKPTVFNFQAPYNHATQTAAVTGLIESGYQNLLDNADFENLVSTTSWTAGTGVTPTLDTSNVYSNKQAVSLALSSTNGLVWSQDVTPTIKMSTQPFEYGIWLINTALTNLQLCARNAGATVGTCQAVPVNANYQYVVLNLSAPSSGSVGVSLFTTGSATGTVVVDNAYVGYARNLYSSNLSTAWQAYTPVFTGFGTVTNIECQQRREGPDNLIRCKFTSGTTTAVEARISLPGSNVSADSSVIPSVQIAGDSVRSGSGADQVFPLIEPSVGYITFGIQSTTAAGLTKANADTFTTTANLFSFEARVPIAGWGPQTALAANNSADLTGTVFYTPLATCPTNSLLADGSTISATTYAALVNKLGTTTLPDLRGIFVRGAGTGAAIGGITYSGTLGTKQNDQMQGHYHNSTPTPGKNVITTNLGLTTPGSASAQFTIDGATPSTGAAITDGTSGTPRTGSETRPANISLTPCIWTVSQNVPLLIGSMVNDGSGILRTFIARVGGASSTTICSSDPCTLYEQSGSAFSSVTRSLTGSYVANFAPGMCSANPKCYSSFLANGLDVIVPLFGASVSTTTMSLQTLKSSNEAPKDAYFDVICTCKR